MFSTVKRRATAFCNRLARSRADPDSRVSSTSRTRGRAHRRASSTRCRCPDDFRDAANIGRKQRHAGGGGLEHHVGEALSQRRHDEDPSLRHRLARGQCSGEGDAVAERQLMRQGLQMFAFGTRADDDGRGRPQWLAARAAEPRVDVLSQTATQPGTGIGRVARTARG